MRLVTANIQIQLFKLEAGQSVLTALGAQGLTVTEVGQQHGHTEIYRGTEYGPGRVPKVRIDLVAFEEADKVHCGDSRHCENRTGGRR
jgi:nitrogen regulatory protein P-II 1